MNRSDTTPTASLARETSERFFVPWFMALAVVTTLAKLILIAVTEGSDDTKWWGRFAVYALDQRSLFAGYTAFGRLFNHPPLGTLVVASAVALGKLAGTPFGLGFWVRLPGLVADLAGAAAIERLLRSRLALRERRLVVAGLLASPLPAAVGIYHGNTDLVWVAVLLWAAWALEARRPALAGALAALAVGIKLPAIVALAPLGLVALRERRGAPFTIGFLAAVAPCYLAGVHWGGSAFVNAVLLYKGTLSAFPWPPGTFLVPCLGDDALSWYRLHGALVVFAAVGLGVVPAWKRTSAAEGLAVAIGLTLLVVATFGPQYLAWFAAPVVLLGWRRALAFHVAAAVQAVILYRTTAPPGLQDPEHSGVFAPWPAVVTWLVLLAVVGSAIVQRRTTQGRTTQGQTTDGQAPPEPAAGGAPGEGGAASRA